MSKIWLIVILLLLLLFGLFYFSFNLKNAYETLSGKRVSSTKSYEDDNFSTWSEFVPQSGLFKVTLPHSPQYAKDLVAIPNSDKKRRYDMYASEKIDGTLFLISMITYPLDVKTSPSDEILKETVEELKRSKPDNRISKSNNSTFETYPAVDFGITSPEFDVEGKAFIVDQIEYVLTYVTRKNDFDPVEYQYFIDSFKLLNKENLIKVESQPSS
jgi:hypothetical protein